MGHAEERVEEVVRLGVDLVLKLDVRIVSGPVAFTTSDPQDPERLRRAPLRSWPRPSRLRRPLAVRPARAARGAETLGLRTVGDLLEHIPHRHEDRREARPVADLRPGEDATVIGEVRAIARRPLRRRGLTLVEATVADATGPIKALWWNQPWVADRLGEGATVILHGRCKRRHELSVSDYELADGIAAHADHHSTGLVPVYPASELLSSEVIANTIDSILDDIIKLLLDHLPADYRRKAELPALAEAYRMVHRPADEDEKRGF